MLSFFGKQPNIWRVRLLTKLLRRSPIYWLVILTLFFVGSLGIWSISTLVFDGNSCRWCGKSSQYVVAVRQIWPGQELAGAVRYEERPVKLAPPDAISSVDGDFSDLEEAVASRFISPGQVLLKQHIFGADISSTAASSALALDSPIPESPWRAELFPLPSGEFEGGGVIAIPIDESSRPQLEIGDRVDLISTTFDPTVTSQTIATDVIVFEVKPKSVNVLLRPNQLEPVVSSVISSAVTLVLVS